MSDDKINLIAERASTVFADIKSGKSIKGIEPKSQDEFMYFYTKYPDIGRFQYVLRTMISFRKFNVKYFKDLLASTMNLDVSKRHERADFNTKYFVRVMHITNTEYIKKLYNANREEADEIYNARATAAILADDKMKNFEETRKLELIRYIKELTKQESS
jgi:hypothetical protein